MSDLLYKELSYKIIGFAFKIYNTLGSGLKEKFYSDAFEELLKQESITYQRELYSPIKIREKIIARNFFDFLIDDKVLVELKSGSDKYKEVCSQTYNYLRIKGLKLGLVIRFTKDGVKSKRIPNLY